ncbi:MAG TPA: protein kinase [Vicinamibacteria bacterium]|nr:protein kinase [Vicinamibacteria bacterium]
MGLTQKILVFISLIVIALAATTLLYTNRQADALAHRTIQAGLGETRDVWETFQADRFNKLKLGVRVLGNDPGLKALIETRDESTILDTLKERNLELKADVFIATDPDGVVIARTDRPGAAGEDLAQDVLVARPMGGEEAASVWRQGERLFHAVSVPMLTGPDLKGVLIAGYALNEALAGDIRKLTHSEIAYLVLDKGKPPALSASSLGPKEGGLRSALGRPEFASGSAEPFEVDLAGEPHIGVVVPLRAASEETVGAVVALRSLATEMAAFRRFRTSLIQVSLVVMAAALGLAYLAARRITDPVRTLVNLVEKARDGSYSGAVSVSTADEIGVLARAFNSLLADLREKEQMIGFLREGMTLLKRGATAQPIAASSLTSAETASIAALPTAVKMEQGALFAGRYEILSTLGKGGMGVVYKAHDRKLDDEVALKVLRPDVVKEDPTLLDRFKQEIKLARKITHRCVLRTHDFGEADGTPYISMEFLEGVTLKDLLRSKGALPTGVGLRIAKQMCQGLDAAHRQGVVHRDIKPQNMLILPETGELKIMDFGIARAATLKQGESGLTTAGTVMGTPDYMPPEQAQGAQADFRSDIYSLGVVLFEVFTGRLPFGGDTAMKVVMAHIQQQPPAPRTLSPRLPEELEAVILRCLAKDPAQRPARVADVLRDLTAVSSQAEAVGSTP